MSSLQNATTLVFKNQMTRKKVAFPLNSSPTPYAALNVVLGYFVERARELLADNFVGAYLQDSFALGDFDEKSDLALCWPHQSTEFYRRPLAGPTDCSSPAEGPARCRAF
jgi:hypothetical protein